MPEIAEEEIWNTDVPERYRSLARPDAAAAVVDLIETNASRSPDIRSTP